MTTVTRTNGLGVVNNGGGITGITPDVQNDHNGGAGNNMSYSFHGSGSVVLGGGMAGGPGSGLGGSGMVGPPPEGYVSANVFSVRICQLKKKYVYGLYIIYKTFLWNFLSNNKKKEI